MTTEVATPAVVETITTSSAVVVTPDAPVPVTNPSFKSIVLSSTGSSSDYSNLQIKEEEYPKMDKENMENMCCVRMKACGLNFAELMQRQGSYKPSTKTPYTPGFEGSGIVEAVGSGVTKFVVNDRVLCFSGNNVWKEVCCLPETNLIKIPDNMTFDDAAGIMVNYITAYQILFRMANLKSGDSILIHMAAGGVGTAAIQLCRTVPNVTIFGTSSASKHDYLKKLGVDYPIDYITTDYAEEIRKIQPLGVDIVLDPMNGEYSIKGFDLLQPLGRVVYFGAASMVSESRSLVNAFKTWWKCLTISSLDIMSENKSISGYHLGYLLNTPACMPKIMADIKIIFDFYTEGKIKINVDSVYPFSKVGEAMRRMHQRKNMGKIIIRPDCECDAVIFEKIAAAEPKHDVGTIGKKSKNKEKEIKEAAKEVDIAKITLTETTTTTVTPPPAEPAPVPAVETKPEEKKTPE